MTKPPLTEPRYVTVLRASAAVRLPPDASMQFSIDHKGDIYEMTFRTRYVQDANQNMPRELWGEVVGPGADANDAVGRAQGAGQRLGRSDRAREERGHHPLVPEICLHMSGESNRHDFRLNFLLDEAGLPRFARTLDAERLIGDLGK